ncbi:MAG: ClpXP protease specificity-enhancing factor [Oxalicibacterium faecigallinarum]|uniref:Stringent starvation protein B n=1 Tax=Oxalicibacterium faecigallinarum TaxID=573741 RepID=A0A8J3AT16_9BURK|nr:ClpXP protease specificity-enhancing factor [Oxalicibacterium faecigallinarum]MDQ7969104.1 ClpXP protease specificity-enhancing factor [Oxalicibacterium faecigallinarum]GGI19710.1 stringent starvation protein B [Oxalicibacterium faecigallinarum]
MSETSTKPYLLRAIYEWCTDNGYTPYMAAVVDASTRVPMEYVKNGEIVLNISFSATSGLKMENDLIRFSARFGGVSRDISVPVDNVVAIYARENGQGMAFEPGNRSAEDDVEGAEEVSDEQAATPVAPVLTSVPTPSTEDVGDGNNGDDNPEPPKKGGRPTLTRVK